jgi:hypothetical protein
MDPAFVPTVKAALVKDAAAHREAAAARQELLTCMHLWLVQEADPVPALAWLQSQPLAGVGMEFPHEVLTALGAVQAEDVTSKKRRERCP